MPPIPVSKLTELALSRRKLFEKIMQHVATRKIQNSIQATGDRMSVTPQQFGMQIGQQVKKSSFAPGGGLGGGALSESALGAPSWEKKEAAAGVKQASVLSVLGGLAGGGLGGLAGGGAGGIIGALGGGALGGSPGAGLGLLAGGAAGLGAGAHMGGNIGADIGRSFSKKKDDKPKSEEKEEKTEEKSEDSGEEEIKKSAAAVLAQLQKNAGKPIVGGISLDELARVRADQAKYKQPVQPMSGVAGAMQRVGDTSAKMPTAGVGLGPKMMGQNIGKAAPTVQAAGNKLVAGEKTMAPANTGGVPMFGVLPGLAGNLGRFLGGK